MEVLRVLADRAGYGEQVALKGTHPVIEAAKHKHPMALCYVLMRQASARFILDLLSIVDSLHLLPLMAELEVLHGAKARPLALHV